MHPKTVEKMDDVSKKWRKSVEHEKANDNARDSVFFLGVKSDLSRVSLCCVFYKHFKLRDLNFNYFCPHSDMVH